jgi:hypothetical protein
MPTQSRGHGTPGINPRECDMKAPVVACMGLFVVVIGVCIGWPVWVMEAPAVPQHRIAALQTRMLKIEVQRSLGEPTGRYSNVDGSESWTYSRGTWAILHVYFDRTGSLTHWVHDR